MMKAIFLGMVATAGAVDLTADTWESASAGKTVFVKFFAPWCGHCKSIKPDWDTLMEEFAEHKSILVADVDCIGDGAALCETIGIEGFPTIKWGDINDLEDYEGERDLESLTAFAKDLKPSCSPLNKDLCDEDGLAALAKWEALSDMELEQQVEEGTAAIAAAEATFEAELEKLQSRYEELSNEKDATIAEVKNNGLSTAKSVLASRTSAAPEEEPKEEL